MGNISTYVGARTRHTECHGVHETTGGLQQQHTGCWKLKDQRYGTLIVNRLSDSDMAQPGNCFGGAASVQPAETDAVSEPLLPRSSDARQGGGAARAIDVSRLPRRIPVKLEPKGWFANERTFLAWASMAVAFAGTSAALTALTANVNQDVDVKGPISPQTVAMASMMLGPTSLAMLWYGFFIYRHRNVSMMNKSVGLYDDRIGPVIMTALVAVMLSGLTFMTYYSYFTSSF